PSAAWIAMTAAVVPSDRLRLAHESPSASEYETPTIWLHSYLRVATMLRTKSPSSSAFATIEANRRRPAEMTRPRPTIQLVSISGCQPGHSMTVSAIASAVKDAVTTGARIRPTRRSIRGRKTALPGSDAAGGNVRHQDRSGAHGVQLVHDGVLGVGGHHGPDGDPFRVAHGRDGGALETGGHRDGVGEPLDRHVVVDDDIAAGDHDALEPADDHLGRRRELAALLRRDEEALGPHDRFPEGLQTRLPECGAGLHNV